VLDDLYMGEFGLPSEDSSGKVYVVSQSSRVLFPKMPTFGYCGACMCVSANR
jgi:hypothetical protein